MQDLLRTMSDLDRNIPVAAAQVATGKLQASHTRINNSMTSIDVVLKALRLGPRQILAMTQGIHLVLAHRLTRAILVALLVMATQVEALRLPLGGPLSSETILLVLGTTMLAIGDSKPSGSASSMSDVIYSNVLACSFCFVVHLFSLGVEYRSSS